MVTVLFLWLPSNIIILTGVSFMLFGNRIGFYIYLVEQLISFIYTIMTGTMDTVWGILILPILIVPIFFGVFLLQVLKENVLIDKGSYSFLIMHYGFHFDDFNFLPQ